MGGPIKFNLSMFMVIFSVCVYLQLYSVSYNLTNIQFTPFLISEHVFNHDKISSKINTILKISSKINTRIHRNTP